MPAYLVAVYSCPSRANAEQVQANFDPGDFSVAEYDLTIHDTSPVVLSGLVKGGEIRTATEWHAAEADALCVASDGRVCQHFWHYEDAVRRGALPLTWYRYETP